MPHLARSSRWRQSLWLAVLLSMAICVAIVGLALQQREMGRRTQSALATLRQGRVDLAQGILHITLSGDARQPFSREEGRAYLEQSIDSLQRVLAEEEHDPRFENAEDRLADFSRKLADSRSVLAAWEKTFGAGNAATEVQLRLAVHQLDVVARELDALAQRQLRMRERESERRFGVVLAVAIALLALVCVFIYFAGRNEQAAIGALRSSEARFRTLFEQAADGILITAPDGTYEEVNPEARRLLGCTREDLIGRRIGSLTPPDQEPEATAVLERVRRGETVIVEMQVQRCDGGRVDVEISGRQLADGHGLWTLRDVGERKRATARAALHHDVTRILAGAAPLIATGHQVIERICGAMGWEFGGLWLLDAPTNQLRLAGHWVRPGQRFGGFVEQSEQRRLPRGEGLPGRAWDTAGPLWIEDIATATNFPRRDEALAGGLRSGLAFPVAANGELCAVFEFLSTTARPIDPPLLALFGTLGAQIGQFVERQRFEEQFRQAQKMEALGTLAGGIAHDFNNILAVIIMSASLARTLVPGNRELDGQLDRVLRAGGRAADLVRQILAFSRQEEQQRAVVQLRHVIGETTNLLRATLPSTIALDVALPAELAPVLADATQIHQVLMNLGTNAWHAMRGRTGRLTIAASAVTLGDGVAAELGVTAGEFIQVTVADTGHGMDAATRERIFEPFFTTKPRGEGTGLGLAVVHGIVRGHGGAITVESAVGVGTTFHLYFPAVTAAEPADHHPGVPLRAGNGELIVVVDDEEVIASALQMLLERLGYRAEMCTDAFDALRRLEALGSECALLLTDHTLPGMTGVELAEKLRARQFTQPIVLSTGYTGDLDEKRLKAAGIAAVLPKPPTVEAVAKLLQQVLAASAATSTAPQGPPAGQAG